jgi:hypothetical protein
VVAAGDKLGIGARCKQSGLFGSVPGAEDILALRGHQAGRRLEGCWTFRPDPPAVGLDVRALAAGGKNPVARPGMATERSLQVSLT